MSEKRASVPLSDWLEDWPAATSRAVMSYTQQADVARC